MRLSVLLLLACLTPIEINKAKCQTACRYLGYQNGTSIKNHCACIDYKKHEDSLEKSIIIPPSKKLNIPKKDSYFFSW